MAKNNRRDHCGNLEIRRGIKWQSFLVACMQTARHFYDPCVFEFSPMGRNGEHGVRLSTFDFTTDLKPTSRDLILVQAERRDFRIFVEIFTSALNFFPFEFSRIILLREIFEFAQFHSRFSLTISVVLAGSIFFVIFLCFKSFRIVKKQDIRRAWLIERYYRLG